MTLLAVTFRRLAPREFLFMLTLSFVSVCAWCDNTTHRPCSKSEERAAEDVAGRLATWAAVYSAYKKFSHCDDGSIGEGFSESISTLLAARWSRIDDLSRSIRRDSQFESFVLRHIDTTVPVERLDKIAANARKRCGKDKLLCEKILDRTRAR